MISHQGYLAQCLTSAFATCHSRIPTVWHCLCWYQKGTSLQNVNGRFQKIYIPYHGWLLGFPKGRGVHDYGILRAWGGNTFWNFRRQGGHKTWKPSVVGYGYFLELPNDIHLNIQPIRIQIKVPPGRPGQRTSIPFIQSSPIIADNLRTLT